jgi:hypothetical protein
LTLYIHMSLENKFLMTRNVWDIFNEKIQIKCLECLTKTGSDSFPPPQVDFIGFKASIGAIVPADQELLETIIKLVATIEVTGKCFKALKKGEKAEWNLLCFLVRNNTLHELHGLEGLIHVGCEKLEVFFNGKPLVDWHLEEVLGKSSPQL